MSNAAQPDLSDRIDACWQLGWRGKSVAGLAEARNLLAEAEKNTDAAAISMAETCVAWFYLQLGHADEGIYLAVSAKSRSADSGDKEQEGLATAVYSWLILEMGLSDLAFDEASRALDIALATDNRKLHAFALNCKGMALVMCRQDQLAFPILEQALGVAEAEGDLSIAALGLINLGFSCMSLGELAEADGDLDRGLSLRREGMVFNDRAIAMAKGSGDLWNLRLALCNGAEGYAGLGKLDIAMHYLAEWEALPGEIGVRERVHYLYTKADVLVRTGDYAAALPVCDEAMVQARRSTNLDNRANTLRLLSEVEAGLGLLGPALEHYRSYHDVFVLQMGEMTRRRAQVVEMQLQNERLRARTAILETEAMQDALTGLANRRAFEADWARLDDRGFCLAIMDLDHFKQVNDRFGHLTGDAVLQRVARLIGGWGDGVSAYRLGGEEFVLLLGAPQESDAVAKADAIRRHIGEQPWSEVAQGLHVTVSIGIAPSAEWKGRDLLAEADRRLYAAKTLGRNRVVGSMPPPPLPWAAQG